MVIDIEKLVKMLQAYLVNFTIFFRSNFGVFFCYFGPNCGRRGAGFLSQAAQWKTLAPAGLATACWFGLPDMAGLVLAALGENKASQHQCKAVPRRARQ